MHAMLANCINNDREKRWLVIRDGSITEAKYQWQTRTAVQGSINYSDRLIASILMHERMAYKTRALPSTDGTIDKIRQWSFKTRLFYKNTGRLTMEESNLFPNRRWFDRTQVKGFIKTRRPSLLPEARRRK